MTRLLPRAIRHSLSGVAPVESLWTLPGWLCHRRLLPRGSLPENLWCRWHTGSPQSGPTGATPLSGGEPVAPSTEAESRNEGPPRNSRVQAPAWSRLSTKLRFAEPRWTSASMSGLISVGKCEGRFASGSVLARGRSGASGICGPKPELGTEFQFTCAAHILQNSELAQEFQLTASAEPVRSKMNRNSPFGVSVEPSSLPDDLFRPPHCGVGDGVCTGSGG